MGAVVDLASKAMPFRMPSALYYVKAMTASSSISSKRNRTTARPSSALSSKFKGRNVLRVEDSIARSKTCNDNAEMARAAGAQ